MKPQQSKVNPQKANVLLLLPDTNLKGSTSGVLYLLMLLYPIPALRKSVH